MGKRCTDYEQHTFYCMNCGSKGIPIPRTRSHRRESLHRKRLYCLHCREEVNHIECNTLEEVEIFKEKFEKGEYKDEVQDSLAYLRSSRLW